jgi:hypothetical protein
VSICKRGINLRADLHRAGKGHEYQGDRSSGHNAALPEAHITTSVRVPVGFPAGGHVLL